MTSTDPTPTPQPEPVEKESNPMLTDKIYNVLKWGTSVGLPALSTCVGAIATIWHWPDTEQIMLTLGAINTLGGALLIGGTVSYNKSSAKYDGTLNVEQGSGKPLAPLQFTDSVAKLDSANSVLLKVNRVPNSQ